MTAKELKSERASNNPSTFDTANGMVRADSSLDGNVSLLGSRGMHVMPGDCPIAVSLYQETQHNDCDFISAEKITTSARSPKLRYARIGSKLRHADAS